MAKTASSVAASLKAALAPYESRLSSAKNMYDAQVELANRQYDTRVKQADAEYDKNVKSTNSRYDSLVSKMTQENDRLKQELGENNARGLREAYISAMQQRKALPQQLSANGSNGGMTETSIVRLSNNYQNSRNNLEREYGAKLGELELKQQQGLDEYERGRSEALDGLAAQLGKYLSEYDLARQDTLAKLGMSYYNTQQELAAQIAAAKAQAEAELAELASSGGTGRSRGRGSSTSKGYQQSNNGTQDETGSKMSDLRRKNLIDYLKTLEQYK